MQGRELDVEVADVLVLVGTRMAKAVKGLGIASEDLRWYEASDEVVKWLGVGEMYQPQAGDCVLIKGSAGLRMERITKQLLHPSIDPREVLVRQEANWQDA